MGHDLVAGFVGLVISLVSPLVNTAAVATAAPDCNLTVSQTSVSSGTAAQVVWWTANASSATFSQDGGAPVNVALSGSVPVTISRNTTLSLTARNSYGAYKTCTAQITITSSTAGTPSCGISAAPGVHYAGQPVQLVWYTQYATAAQISYLGTVSANQLLQGTATVYPSATTLYTMTVANGATTRTCSALVSISPRTTTSYQPVTTQQVTYRPVTTSAPSYSTARSYPTYTYPSSTYRPSYSSGSGLGYGSYTSGSTYSYPGMDTWQSPSYSNGLGDWTLTSAWNNLGTGEGLLTSQNCYGSWCDSEPSAWAYATPLGYDGYQELRVGSYDMFGNNSQTTYDPNGNIIGTNRSISNELFDSTTGWDESSSELVPGGSNGLETLWNSGYGSGVPEATPVDPGFSPDTPVDNAWSDGMFNTAPRAFSVDPGTNYYGATIEIPQQGIDPWADSYNFVPEPTPSPIQNASYDGGSWGSDWYEI